MNREDEQMELVRISEKVWCYPFEEERDRPNLGYVRGDHWSLAVDAGHSGAHVEEFYRALEKEGLPLPSLTVITHWHWDHSFGMHRIHGLSVANKRTNQYLEDFRDRLEREGEGFFLSADASIEREYTGNRPVIVVPSDIIFTDRLELDAGNTPIEIFQAVSPHTDDASLVYLPEEKLLFMGDAPCGVFPTWASDPVLAERFADVIEKTGAIRCLGGHWTILESKEVITDLRKNCF